MFKLKKDKQMDQIPNYNLIDSLLEENNLQRREIPNGQNNFFSAISTSLYNTSRFCDQVQQQCINYIKNETYGVGIHPKLSIFRNNLRLFSEYSSMPSKNSFEKINLKLISIIFLKQVILYFTTEDEYLSSIIANNKYQTKIQLIRIGAHYDLIYSTELFTAFEICQTIVYQTLNNLFPGQDEAIQTKFINLEILYEDKSKRNEYQQQQENDNQTAALPKATHKKSQSLSECQNLVFDAKHFKETSFDLFSGLKIPKEFLKSLDNVTPISMKRNHQSNKSILKDQHFTRTIAFKKTLLHLRILSCLHLGHQFNKIHVFLYQISMIINSSMLQKILLLINLYIHHPLCHLILYLRTLVSCFNVIKCNKISSSNSKCIQDIRINNHLHFEIICHQFNNNNNNNNKQHLLLFPKTNRKAPKSLQQFSTKVKVVTTVHQNSLMKEKITDFQLWITINQIFLYILMILLGLELLRNS